MRQRDGQLRPPESSRSAARRADDAHRWGVVTEQAAKGPARGDSPCDPLGTSSGGESRIAEAAAFGARQKVLTPIQLFAVEDGDQHPRDASSAASIIVASPRRVRPPTTALASISLVTRMR